MKIAAMWITAMIVFFYGISNLGPRPTDNNLLGFLLMAIAFAVPMYFTIKRIGKNAEARNALFVATKALYDKALFDLQEDPENSAKHQAALTKGREYYSYLHPNTQDINGNGVASNFRDNSGIVEAKVQSDIQARTLKGKVS
jgi:hypothetical protein